MTRNRRWRKASASGPNNECIELATDGNEFAIRDSKNPDGPVLSWRGNLGSFVASVKAGHFHNVS